MDQTGEVMLLAGAGNKKPRRTGLCGVFLASPGYLMVPRAGIEPALLSEPDFESGASTNFTTEAFFTALYRFSRSATIYGG